MTENSATAALGRGRQASPLRTEIFLPQRYPSRERSPYIVTDRITGYRSPSADRSGTGNESDLEKTKYPRINQPYKTSFSAVTSLTSKSPSGGSMTPKTPRTPKVVNSTSFHEVGTFPRRGVRATLPDKMKHGELVNKQGSVSSQRSGSADLLSTPCSTAQPLDNVCKVTATRAASCDLLDGPCCQSPMVPSSQTNCSNPFENRRLDPKYSSTPAKFRSASPVMKSIGAKDSYSRMDSNVSSNTLDSVFMSDNQQVNGKENKTVLFSDDPSADISKAPDSGYVEGKVEKKWMVERQYAVNVIYTGADLKKMKKKNELPEPNAETEALVQELKEEARLLRERRANSPAQIINVGQDSRLSRGRLRTTLGKKAQSITNFLRRIQSPRNRSGEKKGHSKRSKSAGRLEGNRIHGRGSNSSIGGAYEISTEGPSYSSDQSSSAFQSSTPSEPMRSSDTECSTNQSMPFDSTTSSGKVQVLVTDSPINSAKNDSTNPNDPLTKTNLTSTSTRRILKSLEDNLGSGGLAQDKSVYRTFKEKQSPGYRRHAEAISMKPQALKAVEIPMQATGKAKAFHSSDDLASQPPVTNHSTSGNNADDSIATIGDCSLDLDKSGSRGCAQNGRNGDAQSDAASRVTLNSKDQSLSPIKSHDDKTTHLPNGDTPGHEAKQPSYVKLSCAVSGYKAYPSQKHTTVSLHPSKPNGDVTTTTTTTLDNNTLDNNNSVVVNGANVDHTIGGELVELEYSPSSNNAYVKKVSERFEKINHDASTVKNKNSYNSSSSQRTVNAKHSEIHSQQNGASSLRLCENSAESHLPVVEQPHSSTQSNAFDISPSSNTQSNDKVDSENINFSQAKLAFVHENVDSGVKSMTGSFQNSKRSAESKKTTNADSHIIHDFPSQSNHSSHMLLDSDLDNNRANGVQDTSCDVTDNAHLGHNDVTVQSITSLDSPAEKIQTVDNEHLVHGSTTHSDNAEACQHMNGDVVNGLDSVPRVSRLSMGSSTDSLDTQTTNKDGNYFLRLMAVEEERIRALCDVTEHDLQTVNMSDEVSGRVRATIGKANLLTTKKFKQFKGLCERNLTQGSEEDFKTTAQDLAGFWDMVLIQVQDVYDHFSEISALKRNDWTLQTNNASPKLSSKPSTPKTPKSRSTRSAVGATPKSAKAQEAARAREEARRKLLEAKKAGRRQRKTSENAADDIEVNIVT